MIQLIRYRGLGGVIIGLIVLVFSKIFFEEVPDFPQVTYTPLFSSIKKSIETIQFLDIILGMLFVIAQAALLSFFLTYHKVIKERSLFPFIIYVLLAAVYNEQFYLNPASFLNFFLILIMERMLRLQDSGKNPGTLFLDIGTLLGLSILFSKEALFYIPFVIIGVLIIYSYNINSILIIALSVVIVLTITAGAYYLSGNFDQYYLFYNFTPLNIEISFSHWQERFYLLLILFILISAVSYLHFQFGGTKISNKVRRFSGVFILFWIVGMLVVLFQKLNLWYNMALLVVPITVFATSFFQDEKGNDWFKNLVFLVLILGLLSVQLNY